MRILRLLALIVIVPIPLSAQTPSSLPSQEALIARLSAFTDSLVKADQFSGVVALVKDGRHSSTSAPSTRFSPAQQSVS